MSEEETNLVEFGDYSVEAAKEDARKSSTNDWCKLQPGDNVFRFLPPLPPRTSPFEQVRRHWINVPGGGRIVFNCPRAMAHRPCIACQRGERLQASPNKADQDAASGWFPSRRGYAAVINRNEPERGPVLVDLPGKKVVDKLRNLAERGSNFSHPLKGFDVVIFREGTGKNDTDYQVIPESPSPLAETNQQMNEWITGQPDITPLIRVPPHEEIRAMFHAQSGQGGEPAVEAKPTQALSSGVEVMPAGSMKASQTAETDVMSAVTDDDDIPF